MEWGLYEKIEGKTGVGMLYQFVGVSRHHTTSEECVVYIPLRIDPSWDGVRFCHLERPLFEKKFKFVSEGLPKK